MTRTTARARLEPGPCLIPGAPATRLPSYSQGMTRTTIRVQLSPGASRAPVCDGTEMNGDGGAGDDDADRCGRGRRR